MSDPDGAFDDIRCLTRLSLTGMNILGGWVGMVGIQRGVGPLFLLSLAFLGKCRKYPFLRGAFSSTFQGGYICTDSLIQARNWEGSER